MIITQEELNKRLNSNGNLVNSLKVTPLAEKPKQPRTPQLPEPVRILAGSLAAVDGASKVAKELGIPRNQVVSAAHSTKPSVKQAIEETRDRVSELALNQLLSAVGLLTADVVSGEKPKDIAAIAASLSKVHANMQPKESGTNAGVNVIIYAPAQKEESHYKVLDV